MNGRSATLIGMGTAIKYDDMCDTVQKGEECEVVYSLPGCAHAIVLVGAGVTNGAPWIMHGSDVNQSSESAGTEQFSFEHLTDSNNDGIYKLSGTNKKIRRLSAKKSCPRRRASSRQCP